MFKLTIETGNAAFHEGGPGAEIGDILDEVARRVRDGITEGRLRDTNGNTVGSFELTEEE